MLVRIVLVFALILRGGRFVKARLFLWTLETRLPAILDCFFWTAKALLVVSHAFFSVSSLQCLFGHLIEAE